MGGLLSIDFILSITNAVDRYNDNIIIKVGGKSSKGTGFVTLYLIRTVACRGKR